MPDNNDSSATPIPSPPDNVTYVSAFDRAHPPTSIEAFHSEEDSGRLQRKRDIVSQAFRKFGPGSSTEVLRAAGLSENLNLWRARVAELTNEGVLKKIDDRRCHVTNHEVAVLQFVEPKDRVRRVRVEPRDAMILELCEALERIAEEQRLALSLDRLAEVHDMIARGRSLARRDRPRQEPPAAYVEQPRVAADVCALATST